MPLIVCKNSPCLGPLRELGLQATDTPPADIRPRRILLLNLMPKKQDAEMEYYRIFAAAPLWVEIIPVKLTGVTYKNTPQAYMDAYYTDIHELWQQQFDGLITTGAPVEQLAFEQVTYWQQLCEVFQWARTHVRAHLFICWGAQAGLYALYGIPKYPLGKKKFGIYPQDVYAESRLTEALSPSFNLPYSCHTEIHADDVAACDALTVVAASPTTGVGVVTAREGRETFVLGHLEYLPTRLDFEYWRDKNKGLPIQIPHNYYENDDPTQPIRETWCAGGQRFYHNWLQYYAAEPTL